MPELIPEIDWDDNVVALHPKEKLKEKMFPHRVSLVIPKTADNKILLCRRAKNKFPFPDVWCCAIGGKVLANESYEAAAYREMKEEVGMNSPLEHVTKFKYNKEDYKAIFAVFTTKDAISKDVFNLDPDEIQYISAFSVDEVNQMIKSNPEEFASTFLAALDAFVSNMP